MIWKFWLTLIILAILSINLYLTAAVYVDAKKQRSYVLYLPPAVWAFVSFFFPLSGFFIYWLMHHSTLVPREKSRFDY
ncbi:MAG TPA: hypothetical protein DEB05_01425 [Firmicutes bacterium]|jgi:peptidoglycan/LPS O-acetylase OafA/YrhL|nr:hypothetical protein [Bacillota bacterium]HBT15599.1 hypothetical protein [Bacillota bacterium]